MSRPDWYPDPTNHDQLRWWDGENWTNRVASAEVPSAYPETDYRRHGQIREKDYSFTLESRQVQTSGKLNEASVRPEPVESPSASTDDLLTATTAPERAKTVGKKVLIWLKSDSNLSVKRRAILITALVVSVALTSVILYLTYQKENNFGKPTNHELVEMKDQTRNSPNIIDSRVTYDEFRTCDGFAVCEPYRITVSGSANFNAEDLDSLIGSIAILKKSDTGVQLCFSDDDIQEQLRKPAQHYAIFLEISDLTENSPEMSGNTACSNFSAEYLTDLAEQL